MEIITKLSVGDYAYFLDDRVIYKKEVKEINIKVRKGCKIILYRFEDDNEEIIEKFGGDIFASKEELAEYWKEKILNTDI